MKSSLLSGFILLIMTALAGCGTGPSTARTPTPGTPGSTVSTSPSATPTAPVGSSSVSVPSTPVTDASPTTPAQVQLALMTLRQRIGQLFMVDCPSSGAGAATIAAIRDYHVGSVILDGNSDLGVVRTGAVTTEIPRSNDELLTP